MAKVQALEVVAHLGWAYDHQLEALLLKLALHAIDESDDEVRVGVGVGVGEVLVLVCQPVADLKQVLVDARDLFEIDETTVKIDGKVYGGEIVYTGPLDELFNLDLGALPYRTLDMKFETLDMDQFQPVGTVNYTTSEDYTRITEFKNMTGQVLPGKTTIMKEYSKAYTPGSGETPYYAILEPENRELYERYLERVQNLTNFHPVGRLAEYRYYDMDAVTNSALDLSDEIIACHA